MTVEPFRFVHCADLHLGSPFLGLSRAVPGLSVQLADAPFAAFARAVDLACRVKAAFLLLAGDIFDTDYPSLRARMRFAEQLRRLDEAGIPVFAVAGNHDPRPAAWPDSIVYPENFHLFSTAEKPEWVTLTLPGGFPVRIGGLSYGRAEVTENLAARYANAPADGYRVGLLHANAGGQPGVEPYAPAALEELASLPVDYWALGHVHQFKILRQSAPVIVYPGCSQGRSVHESGSRGCALVSVDASGRAEVTFEPLAAVEFSQVVVGDLAEVTTFSALWERAAAAVEPGAAPAKLLRVTLRGPAALNAELRAELPAELTAQCAAELARRCPGCELESLRVGTRGVYDTAELERTNELAADIAAGAKELMAEGALEAAVKQLRSSYREVPLFDETELAAIREEAQSRLLDCLTGNWEFDR